MSSTRTDGATARLESLHQRLAVVAEALDLHPDLPADLAEATGTLLDAVVRRARATDRRAVTWLLAVAVLGRFPAADECDDLLARLEAGPTPADAAAHVLTAAALTGRPTTTRPLQVLRDRVVVDVDHSARHNRHTGIQRVTRETCSRWAADHDITLVAWTDEEDGYRLLAPHETARVLAWRGPHTTTPEEAAAAERTPLVVPWRCTLVMPEVPQGMTARPLACLAESSGNAVVVVGYDAIPITTAEMRPPGEPDMYVRYLNVIKHSRRVAPISSSAGAEFSGFAQAVRAQDLRGPDVTVVELATQPTTDLTALPPADRSGRPRVLCVGSREPHKNHLAVLHAAELVWRDGVDFELCFIGGPGFASPQFDPVLARLTEAGRPVRTLGNVSDDDLWLAYRNATVTLFPSLHEGFGLPVAESLACGTPVITTGYGSTRDIAASGGCLLVDPRDDHSIADALRRVLTDAGLHERLAAETAAFRLRSWDEYAADLWRVLVEGTEVTA